MSKNLGQVFTPKYVVDYMLDNIGYVGDNIVGKHVIDNSCGDGAFLTRIVNRYCKQFLETCSSLTVLKKHLETYIHGIEIDENVYSQAKINLSNVAKKYGIENVCFDLKNTNTLTVGDYDGRMDFVVGNPPYVRVHNLGDNKEILSSFRFSNSGMTDLYIAFYEIGLKMLNNTGRLSYICPSSIFTNKAGTRLRTHFIENRLLVDVVNMKHYKVFDGFSTFTCILTLDKTNQKPIITYSTFKNHSFSTKREIEYDLFAINNGFYFSSPNMLRKLKNILSTDTSNSQIKVKNGYATLSDKTFVNANIKTKHQIPVIKASTGAKETIIFPYNKNLELINFDNLDTSLQAFLLENKQVLCNRSNIDPIKWWGFGRSQGIQDTFKHKTAMSCIMKDVDSIKLVECDNNSGVYGGLYIVGLDFPVVCSIIKTKDFIEYVDSLGKYKNNGYYTVSSKDVEKYINYVVAKRLPS